MLGEAVSRVLRYVCGGLEDSWNYVWLVQLSPAALLQMHCRLSKLRVVFSLLCCLSVQSRFHVCMAVSCSAGFLTTTKTLQFPILKALCVIMLHGVTWALLLSRAVGPAEHADGSQDNYDQVVQPLQHLSAAVLLHLKRLAPHGPG